MTMTVRPANDRAHVVLNDPLAVVVERRGGLVEEKGTRVNHKCASDGGALALAAGKGWRRAPQSSCHNLVEVEQ
jgi:hypothetical protein